MNDMLTALLLIDHYAGRKRPEPYHQRCEPIREEESRWARVLAWHRRR